MWCKAGLLCLLAATCLFNNGCGPTYPKAKLTQSLVNVCKKEYNIDVQAKLIGRTIVVFIPFKQLFDSKLDILPDAVEKIENVILSTSRVLFSTDAQVDFYEIIAADVKTTGAELVLVRYMDDVYKFMNGWIKRDDYRNRVLWQVNFDPKILDVKNFDFDVPEITLPGFLAQQISHRLNLFLDSSVVYKLKVAGEYRPKEREFYFSVIVSNNTRFNKVYVPIILNKAAQVLNEYKFTKYDKVVVQNKLLKNKVSVDKNDLNSYLDVNADDLLTTPAY